MIVSANSLVDVMCFDIFGSAFMRAWYAVFNSLSYRNYTGKIKILGYDVFVYCNWVDTR